LFSLLHLKVLPAIIILAGGSGVSKGVIVEDSVSKYVIVEHSVSKGVIVEYSVTILQEMLP
jgi:hypothetical protein